MRRSFGPVFAMVFSLCLFSGCGGSGSGSGGGNQQQGSNPVPHVDSVSPANVTAGAAAQTITVAGSGFVQGAVISFNGTAVPTTYTSSTSLQAQVPASALSGGVLAPVTVTNPSPGGGLSTAVNFSVMAPTPQVSGLSQTNLPQGTAVTITISGSGFESNSTVLWNGTAVPTTFVNSTTLTVALTADQVKDLGNAQVTVNNPGPGGSTTTPVAVVIYPLPTATTVAPSSIPVGSAAQQIVITGTNFVSGSIVLLDNSPLMTTYSSATSLTAQVPASALTNGRNATVAVQNPNPLPGVSSPINLSVTTQTPTLTSLSPSAVAQGLSGTSITILGTAFEANSVAQWNGSPRTTTFSSPTRLVVALTASDLANGGTGQITVNNPGPNGGTSTALTETIVPVPAITSISPNTVQAASSYTSTTTTTLTVNGSNFAANATLTVNGSTTTITSQSSTQIIATLTGPQLYITGPVKVIVFNPLGSGPLSVASQPATLNVINPSASFSVTPSAAAVGSADLTVTIYGSGFFPDSVLQWNGVSLKTTYSSTTSLSAVIPGSMLSIPGTAAIDILTPENQGATPFSTGFSTYVAMPINDIVWNPHDSLLYATIPGRGGKGLGNSLVGLDPATGTIQRTIFVGSEPNRLAISDDGTQAFVGLDGAGAVRQVNLQSGTAGIQWGLGGGQGVYDPPYTAAGMAVLPAQPNSVAVYGTNGVVTIFDSGVARAKPSSGLNTYFYSNTGGLAFGSSASTLYLSANTTGQYAYALTVDGTGVTGFTRLSTTGGGLTVQYDNGRLYFQNGIVADATTGNTLGQFSITTSYSTTPVAVQGPVVSDSALNRAWVVPTNFSSTGQLVGYDETTFNPAITVPVTGVGMGSTGVGQTPADLVRWGQNGLAFHTAQQLYLLHGAMVKDTSSSPADLQVTAQVPSAVTSGSAFNIQLQVTNQGPNDGQGAVLSARLPDGLIYGSTTSSQGNCSGNGVLYCDLGVIKNGASATVTISATPSTAGPIQINATIDSVSFDPVTSNNQVTATTTASGSLYSPMPAVTGISPNMVASGGTSFTLTVNGSGFTSASTVKWNGAALPTTLVNSGQLTATVDSSLIQQLGWAQVTVSSAGPGGGDSGALTLNVYSLLQVPANAMVWDPYTRKLYAVLPSTATTITGNSLVSIDPTSGAIGQPIQVGSEPNLIAETTSGNYLYLGISGADSVARFNMSTQSIDASAPVVSTSYPTGPAAAPALVILPGVDNSIAVVNDGIMDFNGTTVTTRPNSWMAYNNAVFADPGHAYACDGREIYRYSIDSSGVHVVDGTTVFGEGLVAYPLMLDNGLIYASGGGIVDPSTTPMTQIATLQFTAGLYGSTLSDAGVVPYAAEQKSFNTGINNAGTTAVFLQRFDTQHFTLDDVVQLPTGGYLQSVSGMRWGQDGLAYLMKSSSTSVPSQIVIMRGPFVLPAEGAANAAPTVSSVGSGTIAVASGNQRVTVAGMGFLPGASVVWNGVVHDTTFVDAQHLSVAVGASEVTSAVSVSVTCRNPGSGDSNAVTVSVQ